MPRSKKSLQLPGAKYGQLQLKPMTNKGRPLLSIDEQMVILELFAHKWTVYKIAGHLHRNRRTISKFRLCLANNPSLIVKLPVLYQRQGRRSYICKICEAQRDTLEAGYRHVLSHVLPLEIARDSPLDLSYIESAL